MMKNRNTCKMLMVLLVMAAMTAVPVSALAQTQTPTQVIRPKNKYKPADDVKLGDQAANQVARQYPILNDADATAYITRIGQRLVAAIPQQLNEPAFHYRFAIVNARDINAFALPGGPMFVDRGMIEAARNEGEIAGVMAHELSHVVLRHATAQATKLSSPGNMARSIALILGGAALGGSGGAQLGQIFAAGFNLKYSREYESQADTLGAQIMAAANYDPHDLANVFKTIQQQGGAHAPQWLSDHPDPGNRIEAINREASRLSISPNPYKFTRDFERIQARLKAMPRALSMSEIQRNAQNGNPNYPYGGNGGNPTSTGRYSDNIQNPSSRLRTVTVASGARANIPSNWRELSSGGDVQFAPDGAFGDQGITHGVMLGTYSGRNNDTLLDSRDYVGEILQNNSYLRQRGSLSQTWFAERQGFTAVLSGQSPITGRTEVVTIYITQMHDGSLFYAATVVPDDESQNYTYAFRNLLNSIRLND